MKLCVFYLKKGVPNNVLIVPCIGYQVLYTVISGFSKCLSPSNDEC